jgi:hypothetical protein
MHPMNWVFGLNRASNELLRRFQSKPHYMSYYRSLLDRHLATADMAIHLGAGSRAASTLTSADLSRVTVYAVDPTEKNLAPEVAHR